MKDEMLKVFDQNRQEVGIASRDEVHKLGLWHETFHCWFIQTSEESDYIYLQLRSNHKKDYPGLLDITSAGHLLFTETVEDGVREVEEELGIEVSFDELTLLDVIASSITVGELNDNEFAHVFIYESSVKMEDFQLQEAEVAGIVRTAFKQFAALWMEEVTHIEVEGFQIDEDGNREAIQMVVSKEHFVPSGSSYYQAVIDGIRQVIHNKKPTFD